MINHIFISPIKYKYLNNESTLSILIIYSILIDHYDDLGKNLGY